MFRILSETGRITDKAVEAIGLDEQTRLLVQKRFDRLFVEQRGDFMERAVYNDELSEPDAGISVYEVPAASDNGAALREDLLHDFAPLVGEEAAQFLVAQLPFVWFGAYGSLPAHIRIEPDRHNLSEGRRRVSIRFRDPETGVPSISQSRDIRDFLLIYGWDFEQTVQGR